MLTESQPSIFDPMRSLFTPTVLFVLLNVVICTIVFSAPKKKDPRHLNRTSSFFESFRSFSLHRQNTQEIVPRQLSRTSSFFETLRSFNLYRQNTEEIASSVLQPSPQPPPVEISRQLSRTSSFFESLRSLNLYRQSTTQEVVPPVPEAPSKPSVEVTRQLSRSSSILERLRSFNVFHQNTDEMGPIEAVDTVDGGVFTRSASDTHPLAEEMPEKVAQKMKKSASASSAPRHYKEEAVAGRARRPSSVRERKVAKEAEEEVDARADDFINKFREHLKLQRQNSILSYKEMLHRSA